MIRHENQTEWQFATQRFAATFGMETLNAFFDCPTCERLAFAQSLFQSRPLAASILYAIDQSIINANDDHGHAVWSKAWDDCFGATLSMYFDDWSMIESSGLARLNHDIWAVIGDQIQSYGCNWPLVKEETLSKIELDFWQTETEIALGFFAEEPESHWKKEDLLEIAEKRDVAFKRWVQDAFSKANDAKIEPYNLKGNLGLDATFNRMMSKAIANATYAEITFGENNQKRLCLLSDNETAVVLERVSGIWEELDRFQRETYFKGGHWSDCDISRAIHGGF